MTFSSLRSSNGCSRANVRISHSVTANDQTSLLVVNLPWNQDNDIIVLYYIDVH